MLVALAAPVLLGLAFFGGRAVEMLVVAIAIGGAAHGTARLTKQRMAISPIVPALIGVALVGPGSSFLWPALIALLASLLELARARFVTRARLELGVLAYSMVLLLSRGGPAEYLNPRTLVAMPDPIRFWLQSSASGQTPIDPVTLYVGNVPGPVFATSLLAVLLGAAWLWYARRLSLLVLLMFGLGVLASAKLMGWSAIYHLDSGPLWFTAALVLADRRMLPASELGRPLLGLAAGVVSMAARVRGFGIESVPVTVAGLLVVVALVEGVGWLLRNRDQVGGAARTARRPALGARLTDRGFSRARSAPPPG
jgi:NQR2, RnfD, RnfE family